MMFAIWIYLVEYVFMLYFVIKYSNITLKMLKINDIHFCRVIYKYAM